MTIFMLLAIFSAVCSASTDEVYDDSSKMSSSELLNFNFGEFQGMVFASHLSKHIDHADTEFAPPGVLNNSVDVMMGDCAMIYRIPRLAASPAQNLSLFSYKMTRMATVNSGIVLASSDKVGSGNCNGFDLSLDLVSVVKLGGHIEICSAPNGYWSLAGKPCVSVLGFDLGCTDINLSSENVSYCWSVNVALAKASVCAVVKKNCLGFNGEGCYMSFPGWSCKDFDAQATCW